jgi:hypothetical protein
MDLEQDYVFLYDDELTTICQAYRILTLLYEKLIILSLAAEISTI